jgi:hypothetical protein
MVEVDQSENTDFDNLTGEQKKQFLNYLLAKMFTNGDEIEQLSPQEQPKLQVVPEYESPAPIETPAPRFKALMAKVAKHEAEQNGETSGNPT